MLEWSPTEMKPAVLRETGDAGSIEATTWVVLVKTLGEDPLDVAYGSSPLSWEEVPLVCGEERAGLAHARAALLTVLWTALFQADRRGLIFLIPQRTQEPGAFALLYLPLPASPHAWPEREHEVVKGQVQLSTTGGARRGRRSGRNTRLK